MRKASLAVAGLLAGVVGCLALDRSHTPPIVDERGVPVPGALAVLEPVEINGVKQLLLIRGASHDLPVLLFVHGGLGTPYSALAHTFQRDWERRFIVVHWEQRGCGTLYDQTDPGLITTRQLLDDTRAVADHLRRLFGRPIHVIGHSWGSYLAFRTVAAHPELFASYTGVGQTVGILETDRHSHDWALREATRRGDHEGRRALEAIGPPPYREVSRAYEVKYGLVAKYGGFLAQEDGMAFLFKSVVASPEYGLLDTVRFVRGMKNYETALLHNGRDEIWNLSIRDIRSVEVPVHFVYGEHDQTTPGAILETYLPTLDAPELSVTRIQGARTSRLSSARTTSCACCLTASLPPAPVPGPRPGRPCVDARTRMRVGLPPWENPGGRLPRQGHDVRGGNAWAPNAACAVNVTVTCGWVYVSLHPGAHVDAGVFLLRAGCARVHDPRSSTRGSYTATSKPRTRRVSPRSHGPPRGLPEQQARASCCMGDRADRFA